MFADQVTMCGLLIAVVIVILLFFAFRFTKPELDEESDDSSLPYAPTSSDACILDEALFLAGEKVLHSQPLFEKVTRIETKRKRLVILVKGEGFVSVFLEEQEILIPLKLELHVHKEDSGLKAFVLVSAKQGEEESSQGFPFELHFAPTWDDFHLLFLFDKDTIWDDYQPEVDHHWQDSFVDVLEHGTWDSAIERIQDIVWHIEHGVSLEDDEEYPPFLFGDNFCYRDVSMKRKNGELRWLFFGAIPKVRGSFLRIYFSLNFVHFATFGSFSLRIVGEQSQVVIEVEPWEEVEGFEDLLRLGGLFSSKGSHLFELTQKLADSLELPGHDVWEEE